MQSFPKLRAMRKTALLAALLLATASLPACSDGASEGPSPTTSTTSSSPSASPAEAPTADTEPEVEPASARPAQAAPKKPRRHPRERPLPAYQGLTLEDERLSLTDLIGRRFLIFFFNPEVESAENVGEVVAALEEEAGDHNFALLGVAQGSSRSNAQAFVARHGIDAPILLDGNGGLAGKVGLRAPVALALADAEGYLVNASLPPEGVDDPKAVLESELRDWLRLPPPGHGIPQLANPVAPTFRAAYLDQEGTFDLAAMRGEPLVLIFFLHTCPHCHHALRAIKKNLDAMPKDARPNLVGVSVYNKSMGVKDRLEADGLDFFTVLTDFDGTVRNAYGANGGVPVVLLIDAEGRIISRTEGWRDDRDPPLLRMRMARIAGQPIPMLLHRSGYSGNEFCTVCHEQQGLTWELTNHGGAFDTLVRHGADRDGECVGCHVVGYEQAGGWSFEKPDPALEDVGCETCHGQGGPHTGGAHPKTASEYEAVCVGCHNKEHSLGFEYASFVPRVSHAANAALAQLSPEEIARVLEERRKPRSNILPDDADYVGSAACQSCHAAEYQTWLEQPHAKAVATLEAKGEAGNAECLACHTTGFDKQGGFPAGGTAGEHPALAAVGCESCHGPGSAHIAEGSRKLGTIISLGDKCDSCVILQICGGCHDDANDPGFEFQVQPHIDRQRHGTIEAGTGKPKSAESAARLPSSAVAAALEAALRDGVDAGSAERPAGS